MLSESTKTFTSRADVSRIVLTPQNYTRLAVPLLPLASAKLKRVFGWDMISVPTFTKKGKYESAGTKDFSLRLTSQLEDFMAPVRDEMPTSVSQGFLMVVLAIILMNNFAIEDTVLMTMLRKYNLGGEEPLEQFENKRPIELIRELVKQHYLTMKREVEGDISSTFVTIGPRSLLEIGKSNILRFINEVCGTQPDTSALKALVEEEEEFLPSPALGAKDPTVRPAANGEQQAAPVEEIEEAQPNGVVANGAANGNHNAPAPDASQASQPTQRSRRSRGGR